MPICREGNADANLVISAETLLVSYSSPPAQQGAKKKKTCSMGRQPPHHRHRRSCRDLQLHPSNPLLTDKARTRCRPLIVLLRLRRQHVSILLENDDNSVLAPHYSTMAAVAFGKSTCSSSSNPSSGTCADDGLFVFGLVSVFHLPLLLSRPTEPGQIQLPSDARGVMAAAAAAVNCNYRSYYIWIVGFAADGGGGSTRRPLSLEFRLLLRVLFFFDRGR